MRKFLVLLLMLAATGWTTAQESQVTLPLEEFLRLTGQSDPTGNTHKAPVSHMFSRGDYRLSPEGKWVRVEAKIALRTYQKGWTEIPLLPSGVFLESGTLGSKPLPVYTREGEQRILLRGAGRHQLKLAYYLPLSSSGATRSVSFRSPSTSVSNLRLVLPGDGLKVEASPKIPLERHPKAGRTVVVGTVPANLSSLNLSWTPLRADPRLRGKVKQEKPKIYARVYQVVTPGEKQVRSQARIDFTILRNEVKRLVLKVDPKLEVDQVSCPQLEDWERTRDGRLVVRLAQPVSGSHTLTLVMERPHTSVEGEWALPTLGVEGVERVKGSIGVVAAGGIEVEAVSQTDARAIDVRELPSQVTALNGMPLSMAFEYSKQPFEVRVRGKKGRALELLDATIDQARGVTLVTTDGKVCTAFTFELRNHQRQSIRLRLPEGAQIWSSFVAEKPVKPVKDDGNAIRLPLTADDGTRSIPVRLVYIQEAPTSSFLGRQDFQAPEVDIPISVMNWTVHFPTDREIVSLSGSMREGAVHDGLVVTGRTESAVADGSGVEKNEIVTLSDDEDSGEYKDRAQKRRRLDNARMSQMIRESTRGSFPVEVQIPETGQAFHFSKLLVEDEPATIGVRYASASLNTLALVAVFVVVLAGARRFMGSHQGGLVLLGLTLGLLMIRAGLGAGFIASALASGAAACLLVLLAWVRHHRERLMALVRKEESDD